MFASKLNLPTRFIIPVVSFEGVKNSIKLVPLIINLIFPSSLKSKLSLKKKSNPDTLVDASLK